MVVLPTRSEPFVMSGLKFLLDTNIVIGLLKSDVEALALCAAKSVDFANSAVSQITRMELLSFPRLTAEEDAAIRSFLNACTILLITEDVERAVVSIRKSVGLKLPDAIVAASAQANGLELVTLDKSLSNAIARLT